jgi:HK97 family phage major capsid protein/HK97 family phage prohead protease
MEIEHKSYKARVESIGDEGEIIALVSCFNNVDRAKEVVRPGAFTASLSRKLPKGVWAHDWTRPIAKTLEARETPQGLVVKAKFNLETQAGYEAHSNIRAGIIDEFSIGYRVTKDSFDKKSGTRNLEEIELFEWSPVLVGANDSTQLLSIKQATSATSGDPMQPNVDTDYAQLEDRLKALETKDSKTIIRPRFSGVPMGAEREQDVKSLGQGWVDSREYQNWRASKSAESSQWQSGIELKAVLTTTGGWPVENVRSPVMVPFASRQPRVVDLLPTIQTSQNAYVYMEETTFTNAAVEVAEGAAKPEATLALTQRTSPVRKIAAWLAATDEQLDDVVGMQAYVEQRLSFMVAQRLDQQILTGNGTAPNLLGILNVVGIQTQAKATDPTPDAIYKAINKVRSVGQAEPNAVVIHPNDWQDVQLLRTTDGIYIAGSPWTAGPETIFGKPVIVTTAITEGTALVGDFANFSQLAERQQITVKVGYQNDDFIKNQKSIVGETRVAVVWYRPAAFCTVTGV